MVAINGQIYSKDNTSLIMVSLLLILINSNSGWYNYKEKEKDRERDMIQVRVGLMTELQSSFFNFVIHFSLSSLLLTRRPIWVGYCMTYRWWNYFDLSSGWEFSDGGWRHRYVVTNNYPYTDTRMAGLICFVTVHCLLHVDLEPFFSLSVTQI